MHAASGAASGSAAKTTGSRRLTECRLQRFGRQPAARRRSSSRRSSASSTRVGRPIAGAAQLAAQHPDEWDPVRRHRVGERHSAALRVPAQDALGREANTGDLLDTALERQIDRNGLEDLAAAIGVEELVGSLQIPRKGLAVVAVAGDVVAPLAGHAPSDTANLSAGTADREVEAIGAWSATAGPSASGGFIGRESDRNGSVTAHPARGQPAGLGFEAVLRDPRE